jgi:hypothetical protein
VFYIVDNGVKETWGSHCGEDVVVFDNGSRKHLWNTGKFLEATRRKNPEDSHISLVSSLESDYRINGPDVTLLY